MSSERSERSGPPTATATATAQTDVPGADDRASAPEPDGPPAVEIGDTLDRYRLDRKLGKGSFGVVYEAQDLDLGRRVAVKVLRERWHDEEGQGRFHREAIACARLNHPNIVALYDYGSAHGVPYLVFELVDGASVRSWLRERTRSADEVLEVFRAGGRGLAAAHAAGLVHRDVKPDNLLVGRDGTVRIADFGLARATGGDGEAGIPVSFAGTPRYMAPEQRRAGQTTPRSDQFSFCVALAEALGGSYPLDEQGRPLPLGELPRRVREPIARGLRTDPAERHPSMNALLAALAPRRRGRWAALAAVAAVTAALLLLARARRPDLVCRGGERKLAGRWDRAARRGLETRFLAARAGAGPVFASFAAALDDYAAAWTASHREACEATQLRREQPAEVQALRMSCLDDRLRALGALTAAVAAPELDVEAAVRAAHALPPIADCDDVAALRAPAPLPADPELRRAVAATRELLAGGRARYLLGRVDAARAIALGAVGGAAMLPFAPLRAEAVGLLAEIEDARGEYVRAEALWSQALSLALEHRQEKLAAGHAGALAFNLGISQRRLPEARRTADLSAALARRTGDQVTLLNAVILDGVLAYAEGRYPESERQLRAALALAERVDRSTLNAIHNNLAALYVNQGRWEEADAEYRQALELDERLYGADSVMAAQDLGSLGTVRLRRGDTPGALAAIEQARARVSAALGADSAAAAVHTVQLADVLFELGRYDEVVTLCEQALAVLSAKAPLGAARLAAQLMLASALPAHEEMLPRARREAQLALDLYLQAYSWPHDDAVTALLTLGAVEADLHDFDAADATLGKALAGTIALHGAEAPETADVLRVQAHARHAAGRRREAVELGQRALAIWAKVPEGRDPQRAQLRAEMVEDLEQLGRRDEAARLAAQQP